MNRFIDLFHAAVGTLLGVALFWAILFVWMATLGCAAPRLHVKAPIAEETPDAGYMVDWDNVACVETATVIRCVIR